MVVLFATLFLSIGLINFDFSRRWWQGQIQRLVVGVPLVLAYAYFEMPPLVFPQAFSLLLLTLVPNVAYSLLIAARTLVFSKRIVSIRRLPARPYLAALGVVGVFTAILAIAPIVDASGLRDVVDAKTAKTLPPSADIKHIRVVPQEAAEFAGNKVIGQLGAYYRVGGFSVQVANGKLVWVAPLEFHGVIQWLSRRTSPGVIIVSAEDPDASPELRQRKPMRFVPSALLNDNLYRHVYLKYGTELILETTLQLDENGDPQYLCTLGRPTIGWSGTKVTGVVIVDPSTGQMRRVDRTDFAKLPKWVSRVYPADLALDYNQWFGLYVHGLINALVTKRDVHVPARDEVFGILAGERFVWFVDHTSPASDQSMTGFTYMDTVTGEMEYYTSSGGEFNSQGAEEAVASNPVVRQGKLYPTQPLLYNAFGGEHVGRATRGGNGEISNGDAGGSEKRTRRGRSERQRIARDRRLRAVRRVSPRRFRDRRPGIVRARGLIFGRGRSHRERADGHRVLHLARQRTHVRRGYPRRSVGIARA